MIDESIEIRVVLARVVARKLQLLKGISGFWNMAPFLDTFRTSTVGIEFKLLHRSY